MQDKLFIPHPEEWGGAYVDGDTLVVNTVRRSPVRAAKVLRKIGVTRGVTIRKVDVSMAQHDTVTADVMSDPLLRGSVVAAGPEYRNSQVVVGVRDGVSLTRAAKARLKTIAARSGVPTTTYNHRGDPVLTNRYWDTSPYNGGDNVNFGPGGGCSNAFAWKGGQYMVSAAHCYTRSGLRVFRYKTGTKSVGKQIGKVLWSSANASGTTADRHGDVVVWKATGGLKTVGRIYTGTGNATAKSAVKDRTSLPEGWKGPNLYTSGAGPFYGNGSGQINPDWISLVNQTIYFRDTKATVANLTVAEHSSACIGKGDSGGAFYLTRPSGGVRAVGVISGTNNGGGSWTNCRNYYTPLEYVASDFGGAVKKE
ncbi:MAG: hypothetical protein U0990_10700 [Candidatus Nanopelagicales bacterium]|nr:hypothetical protein [Candidatus Nanopelagicales bacterium]MDZ4250537.1 hypothetical protein [Candidatus Nanopelagicales bacterium]